jgi:hypothetical protein
VYPTDVFSKVALESLTVFAVSVVGRLRFIKNCQEDDPKAYLPDTCIALFVVVAIVQWYFKL